MVEGLVKLTVRAVGEDVEAQIAHVSHHLTLNHRNCYRGPSDLELELLPLSPHGESDRAPSLTPDRGSDLVDCPALDRLVINGDEDISRK
jgi:hypothetical protein